MQIEFHFLQQVTLKDRTDLRHFISEIFRLEKIASTSLSVIFCNDAYLLDINRSFLQHNFFTDIITFNLAETGHAVAGEIYISVDSVIQNAKDYRQSQKKELHRVIFHGVLHLCGYLDKTASEKLTMRAAEDKYLKKYFK